MIRFELKKLFIKQYGIFLILFAVAVKLFVSRDLFLPDYSGLSPEQQVYFLQYIDELGGQLTDEKEEKIVSLYAELLDAQAQYQAIQEKYKAGGYEDIKEYFDDLINVPDVISHDAAIERIFQLYEIVNIDRENRMLIASDAPAMQIGFEFLLMIIICYISAYSSYYERKTMVLQKPTPKNVSTICARLTSIFLIIVFVWLSYAVIELSAIIAEIGASNLSVSAVSLPSFNHANYPSLTILQTFIYIQLTKLTGYVFLSSTCILLATLSGNFPLSIFVPAAINIVWMYLFDGKTPLYYSPFSLMYGYPYFIGGDTTYKTFELIPFDVLVFLIIICLFFVALVCWIVIRKNGNRIKKFLKRMTALTAIVILLSGCSANLENGSADNSKSIAFSENNIFICNYILSENNTVAGTNISMYDSDLNLTEENIVRNIFLESKVINNIFASDGYLYYLTDDDISLCSLRRINLECFTEETVYESDYGILSSGETKYLDLIKVYSNRERSSYIIKSFIISGDTVILIMEDNTVSSLDMRTGLLTYLFEDVCINGIAACNGKLFYLDMDGKLTGFDGKKIIISDRSYSGLCADGEYIYCCGDDGTFRYSSVSYEEIQLDSASSTYIDVKNGFILLGNSNGYWYVSLDGKRHDISLADESWIQELSDKGRVIAYIYKDGKKEYFYLDKK